MKLKLLTIGILALLLCAMVPMAATAAGRPAPDGAKVYAATYNPRTGGYELGKVVGTVTSVDASGNYEVHLKNTKAGDYQLAVSSAAAWSDFALSCPCTDAIHLTEKSDVPISDTLPNDALTYYGNDGVFVLVRLLPM